MAARRYGIIMSAIVAGGTAWWAWSTYCEAYGLCYPACRAASNGVEYWKTVAPVTAKSDWVAAEASPGSECLALLAAMRRNNIGKRVAIDYVDLAGARKPAPFYQYDCTFDIKEPVFVLGRNQECAAARQNPE